MSYGLSVFKSNGSLVFSSADVAWMQLDKFIVNANASVSNTYSVASGMTIITQIQMVDDSPTNQEAYAPQVSISGTTVSIAPYSGKTSEKVIVFVLAQDT
jgi:hypothetical protein